MPSEAVQSFVQPHAGDVAVRAASSSALPVLKTNVTTESGESGASSSVADFALAPYTNTMLCARLRKVSKEHRATSCMKHVFWAKLRLEEGARTVSRTPSLAHVAGCCGCH